MPARTPVSPPRRGWRATGMSLTKAENAEQNFVRQVVDTSRGSRGSAYAVSRREELRNWRGGRLLWLRAQLDLVQLGEESCHVERIIRRAKGAVSASVPVRIRSTAARGGPVVRFVVSWFWRGEAEPARPGFRAGRRPLRPRPRRYWQSSPHDRARRRCRDVFRNFDRRRCVEKEGP